MATKNSINNKTQDITIDPGASGDSYIQFDINGTGEFRAGVDDTASDAFKISQGSALGTTDAFVMTATGERTMPLQPSFMAYSGSSIDNITGDGTTYTIGTSAMTEVYDQGGDFNTNGTFTAPITGCYKFDVGVMVKGIDSNNTTYNIKINTSNGTYTVFQANSYALRQPAWWLCMSGSIICDMDASDTATLTIQGSNGAKTIDLYLVGRSTFFSGRLLC